MSFEVTVTPTVYNVEVEVNPSVQPFDVVVEVGNVPDLDLTTNGDSGASTFNPLTGELNIPEYTLDGLGGVPESRTLTINGTTQDLSANRTFTIATSTPVTIGSPANGLSITPGQVLSLALASGSQTGALSSGDWTIFNGKQNALGFTAENVANKSTDTALGSSSTLYPSQGAVKSYVDTQVNPVASNIQALGSISGTVTINLALGTLITATLTGATTLAFSGLPPSGRETAFTLRFAGIHAITLPVGTKYPAGAVPVPAGSLYEIPCTINNAGELIVYGVINDIKTP
jgi:hypothetical protein